MVEKAPPPQPPPIAPTLAGGSADKTQRPDTLVLVVLDGPWARAWERLLHLAFVLALIGPGILMDSAAMQWLGFLCVIIGAVGAAIRTGKTRVTPQEAADRLLAECGVTGRAPGGEA